MNKLTVADIGDAIDLGDIAKDRITQFSGVVEAITRWLNGCTRITLRPTELDKDGKPQESQTFDIEQIVVVTHNWYAEQLGERPAASGGPMPATPRR